MIVGSSSSATGEGGTRPSGPGGPLAAPSRDDGRRSEVRLSVPAHPENVSLVRHVLGALGDALRLPAPVVGDLRLAVTEACTNVVRHAYADGEGTIEVAVRPGPDTVRISIEDRGRGTGPSPDTNGPGLGLPLIAALTDAVEIECAPNVGSRVNMSFSRSRAAMAAGMARAEAA
jgi:serine/threonine-protein kinase RsbW